MGQCPPNQSQPSTYTSPRTPPLQRKYLLNGLLLCVCCGVGGHVCKGENKDQKDSTRSRPLRRMWILLLKQTKQKKKHNKQNENNPRERKKKPNTTAQAPKLKITYKTKIPKCSPYLNHSNLSTAAWGLGLGSVYSQTLIEARVLRSTNSPRAGTHNPTLIYIQQSAPPFRLSKCPLGKWAGVPCGAAATCRVRPARSGLSRCTPNGFCKSKQKAEQIPSEAEPRSDCRRGESVPPPNQTALSSSPKGLGLLPSVFG